METLKTVNQPNIDKLLQGQVPGMTIMSTSGAPGAVPQIRIRGTSTISGNVQPLWVVDGVILDDPVDATVDDILTNRKCRRYRIHQRTERCCCYCYLRYSGR